MAQPRRLLLCRPQGGLNDMLSQVERCCRYAEQTGRTVIVDTNYAGSFYFKDELGKYFTSRQSKLVFGLDPADCPVNEMDVEPGFLQGRVTSYVPEWLVDPVRSAAFKREKRSWTDPVSGLPTTFDFSRDHPQELLVHHGEGAEPYVMLVFLRMTLNPQVTNELARRMKAIGGPYDAIHVRHTDYRSSYEQTLAALRASHGKLFVATDNIDVVREFRQALGAGRVFSFSKLPPEGGVPVHKTDVSLAERYARNVDAIVDLLMLALSKKLAVTELKPPALGRYSGFSTLAHSLWSSKAVVSQLLGRSELKLGLD